MPTFGFEHVVGYTHEFTRLELDARFFARLTTYAGFRVFAEFEVAARRTPRACPMRAAAQAQQHLVMLQHQNADTYLRSPLGPWVCLAC